MRTIARHVPALVAVALLALPTAASAQTTETEPLGDYGQTTPTGTLETTPAQTETPPTQTETPPAGGEAGASEEGGAPGAATPQAATGAAEPAQQESALAFTGFEALAVGLVGIALMGGAVVLQRRRRDA